MSGVGDSDHKRHCLNPKEAPMFCNKDLPERVSFPCRTRPLSLRSWDLSPLSRAEFSSERNDVDQCIGVRVMCHVAMFCLRDNALMPRMSHEEVMDILVEE